MALTPKLIAEYTELLNEKLDSLPINEMADFERVIHSLNQILTGEHEALKNDARMLELVELYDSPELYVEQVENYQEFKDLILARIRSKIIEFQSFNPEQKTLYIQEQEAKRQITQAHHQMMAQRQAPAPGDEAHVSSAPLNGNLLLINPQVYHHVTVEFIAQEASEPDYASMPAPLDVEEFDEEEEEEEIESGNILNLDLRSGVSRLFLAQAVSVGILTLSEYIDLMRISGFHLSSINYTTAAGIEHQTPSVNAQGFFRIHQHFRVPQINEEDLTSIFLQQSQQGR